MKMTPLTLNQIKSWNLNINQLKNLLTLEIKESERLQAQLHEAELELSNIQASRTAFHETSIKNFSVMTQAENNFEEASLIAAIKNLRDQNLQTMAQIGKTKALTKEIKKDTSVAKSLSSHDKYARVMDALKSQAADIRVNYPSEDVLEMDDIVMEELISYEGAKEVVDNQKAAKELVDKERKDQKEGQTLPKRRWSKEVTDNYKAAKRLVDQKRESWKKGQAPPKDL